MDFSKMSFLELLAIEEEANRLEGDEYFQYSDAYIARIEESKYSKMSNDELKSLDKNMMDDNEKALYEEIYRRNITEPVRWFNLDALKEYAESLKQPEADAALM